MEHFYQNIGEDWFTYPQLYSSMVNKFNDGSHFVEVGSWKGRSSAYMAVEILNSGKKIKFDCIDTFQGSSEHLDPNSPFYNEDLLKDDDWLYKEFLNNTKSVKEFINPIIGISWDKASSYEDGSLDFVFLDAAHDYESVKKDIISWLPKVKKGGVLSGHDMHHFEVYNAVAEILGIENIIIQENCWIYGK